MDHLTSSVSVYSNVGSDNKKSNSTKPLKSYNKKFKKLIMNSFNFIQLKINQQERVKKSDLEGFGERFNENLQQIQSEKESETYEDRIRINSEGFDSHSSFRRSPNYSMVHNLIISQSQKVFHSNSNLIKDPELSILELRDHSILNFEILSSSSSLISNSRSKVLMNPFDKDSSELENPIQNLLRKDDDQLEMVDQDEKDQNSGLLKRKSRSSLQNDKERIESEIKESDLNSREDLSKSNEIKFKCSKDSSESYQEPIYEDKSTWISSNVLKALWNLLEGDET
ncbi:hypothetical protein DFH28DRAFT_887747 [Melampsora americana]|nr:hypothetical protein DFH28DRAFT_887747 [Melampsora americana]